MGEGNSGKLQFLILLFFLNLESNCTCPTYWGELKMMIIFFFFSKCFTLNVLHKRMFVLTWSWMATRVSCWMLDILPLGKGHNPRTSACAEGRLPWPPYQPISLSAPPSACIFYLILLYLFILPWYLRSCLHFSCQRLELVRCTGGEGMRSGCKAQPGQT